LSENQSVHEKILQMVESGTITAEEASRLLEVTEETTSLSMEEVIEPRSADAVAPAEPLPAEYSGPPEVWDSIWVYVFSGGAVLAALGAAFTIPIAQGNIKAGWLGLTIPAMLLGTLLSVVTWWSRSSRWMHLRIQDEEDTIKLCFPVPLGLVGASLRLASLWSPKLRKAGAGDIVSALASADLGGEGLLFLDVDDDESGDQVRITIS
jgi:hypothetical protein